MRKVPRRIASTIINSLKGGVVPRVGLPYVAVGREAEIDALLHDIGIIAEGGAAFRFIVGKYGSGKSFLLQIVRSYAMDRNFVVMDADLSPERRLQGTHGQGLATYKELVRNMSTKTRPEGGALTLILDRWISGIQTQVAQQTGLPPQDPRFASSVNQNIRQVVGQLSEMVHGFDFAQLLTAYYRSYQEGDDNTKAKVVKWFRGEYANKTEARRELGVGICITDDDWYEHVKLFASFLKQAGYAGLIVLIDELVNIYKIPNAITRQYNYEKILTMYNDTLQGKAHHLGIIMGGTPQCVEDQRRGIYSYEALRSRLVGGRFADERYKDMLAPVIRLQPLSYEELLVLAGKLQDIHAGLFGYEPKLSDEELATFIATEFGRVGARTHITPREVIRDFIELLDIMYQNPEMDFISVISTDRLLAPAANATQAAPLADAARARREAPANIAASTNGNAHAAAASRAAESSASLNGARENPPIAAPLSENPLAKARAAGYRSPAALDQCPYGAPAANAGWAPAHHNASSDGKNPGGGDGHDGNPASKDPAGPCLAPRLDGTIHVAAPSRGSRAEQDFFEFTL